MALVLGTAIAIAIIGGRAETGAATAATSTAATSAASAPTAAPAPATSAAPEAPPGSATTAPTPTTQAPATTTAIPPTTTPRRATLAVSGDIITHLAVGREAWWYAAGTEEEYDFTPMFAPVADVISGADLAICHLESPLSFDGEFTGFPRFGGPHHLAEAIANAGFDGCSLASNHAFDQQEAGVASTLDVLDASGLGASGTARSPSEARTLSTYDAAGFRVAHLSATYWINGFTTRPGDEWRVEIIDVDDLIAEGRRARAEGADFVVMSLHWGEEYQRHPSDLQLAQADALARSGAVDVIVGHHAHVVQPIQWIEDTLVLYGLGNFLSNQEPKCCTAYSQDGLIVEVELGDVSGRPVVLGYDLIPTWVDRSTMEILPVVDSLASPEDHAGWVQRQLEASLSRTLDSLSLLGDAVPPPR